MLEYVLAIIIILLIIIIFLLVRKEHFTISDIYQTIKDKIISGYEYVVGKEKEEPSIVITDDVEQLEDVVEEYPVIKVINDKYTNKKNTIFTPTLFHPDYVDVINVIHSMTNSPNTRVFNKDNKRTSVVKGDEDEINMIGDVVEKFVENVNNKLIEQPKHISEVLNINRWDNQPEQSFVDGFEKVRSSLGLPKKLYNTSVSGNSVELVNYSDVIVEKVMDEDNEEYSCDITIRRDGSRDKMIFRFKFIIEDNRVIIDGIDIIGFDNERDVSEEYNAINDFYDYKSLNKHNITPVGDILSEMKDKYLVKEKMMQDNIDNLHPEDKLMNMRINPYQYESFKATRTVYDDIWEKPLFE